jgi:hypothetical protein
MLSLDYEQLGASVAQSCESYASLADFRAYNYKEPLKVGKWIQLSQYTALDSDTYVLEDGPESPKTSGPHADEGGEVLERMYDDGCTSVEE